MCFGPSSGGSGRRDVDGEMSLILLIVDIYGWSVEWRLRVISISI